MLYHKDIVLPTSARVLLGQYKTVLTSHAKESAKNDSYGEFIYPSFINVNRDNIIEMEIIDESVSKFTIRLSYNNEYDLCVVIIPRHGKAIIKTGWLNCKSDNHKTLDKSKYIS